MKYTVLTYVDLSCLSLSYFLFLQISGASLQLNLVIVSGILRLNESEFSELFVG